MKANSIGSVTPTKNAPIELAKTKHTLAFAVCFEPYDKSLKQQLAYRTSLLEKPA